MDIRSLPKTWKFGAIELNLCFLYGPGGWVVTYQNEGKDYFGMTPNQDLQSSIDNLVHKLGIKPKIITPEWLESNGYEHKNEFGVDEWISQDHQVIISKTSNMAGRDWYVHVDNPEFETIGGMCIQEIWQLSEILRLLER